ncbi:hypothetical protein SAMN05421768_11015 [Chryseobacterium joostei]|uniref:Uncharacterized protein n=1 Tax=Chryseobacterium joostei TaxID=112234 RepID=A0A1N7K3X2_9FLAO|nr:MULTISPECIES: hypothetical protein [Chryseobacterium]SIS56248.1 hypothetical protein SAMN05421768_11015 [Chryseobacterium joostei]
MKKAKQTEKKISLKKLQITKINNPGKIFGGTKAVFAAEDCEDIDNGSKPRTGHDTGR